MRRVDEVQRPEGYRIVGAFEGERCLAVAGFRELNNLAWGHVVYVDDLSTHPDGRRHGHGRALLEWCAEEAKRLGCARPAPRLRRGGQPARRAPALPQHGHAHHELPFREADPMIEAAERLALVAERELEALVGVSTPSGDVAGAEEAVALCVAFLPPEAEPERLDVLHRRATRRPARAPARQRRAPAAAARPPRHGRRARGPPPADPRRRPPARLGHGRHEGRRGPGARRDARAGRAARAVRRGGACCS